MSDARNVVSFFICYLLFVSVDFPSYTKLRQDHVRIHEAHIGYFTINRNRDTSPHHLDVFEAATGSRRAGKIFVSWHCPLRWMFTSDHPYEPTVVPAAPCLYEVSWLNWKKPVGY